MANFCIYWNHVSKNKLHQGLIKWQVLTCTHTCKNTFQSKEKGQISVPINMTHEFVAIIMKAEVKKSQHPPCSQFA